MKKLKIFLKSGHTIDVECDDWKFTKFKESDEFSGYKLKGLKNLNAISLASSQIAGFIELKE